MVHPVKWSEWVVRSPYNEWTVVIPAGLDTVEEAQRARIVVHCHDMICHLLAVHGFAISQGAELN